MAFLTRKTLIGVMMGLALSARAQDGTWLWSERGLTPVEPALWSDSANWVDGVVPDAEGEARFNVANGTDSATPRWIRLPDGGVTVAKLTGSSSCGPAKFLGDGTLTVTGTLTGGANTNGAKGPWFFCPVRILGGVKNALYFCGALDECPTPSSGYLSYCPKWFATSDAETIIYTTPRAYATGGQARWATYYPGRRDGATVTAETFAGSRYVRLSDVDATTLCAGAKVTVAGVARGYLKTVLDAAWVELSKASAETATGVELTIAAFAPTVRHEIESLTGGSPTGQTYGFGFYKFNAADSVTVDVKSASATTWLVLQSDTDGKGNPSTVSPQIVLHEVADLRGLCPVNAHVVFPESAGSASPSLYLPTASTAKRDSVLSVADGVSLSVARIGTWRQQGNYVNKLHKTGAGELTVTSALAETDDPSKYSSPGMLFVDEGTLVWTNDFCVDGEPTASAPKLLDVAADATFRLGVGLLAPQTLKVATGARVCVDAAAKLTLPAAFASATGVTLGGRGTLACSASEGLTLASATFEVAVADRAASTLTVDGALACGAGATIRLPDAVATLPGGAYPIVRATSLAADEDAVWTVSPSVDAKGRTLTVSKVGNELVLDVPRRGLAVIIR